MDLYFEAVLIDDMGLETGEMEELEFPFEYIVVKEKKYRLVHYNHDRGVIIYRPYSP